ncbi:MAG: hypothetical protein JNL97_09715, partial [Verrucomicrobiales bacterium]|nr:hypothetical protein [Verrucomicrobiales bacterium]
MERPNDESAARSPMRRRGATRDERRKEAGVAVRRFRWLLEPLVFWSGTPPPRETVPGSVYRPVTDLLARRLAGLSPGIYSANLAWPEPIGSASSSALHAMCRLVNPRGVEVRRIGEREVSEAARSLRGLARHAATLAEWTGADAEALRSRATAVFPRLTAALNAGSSPDSADGSRLAIEDVCWWLGPEDTRPSRRISDDRLRAWLAKDARAESDAGWLAGWLLAGQRRLRIGEVPDEAMVAYRVGAAFPAWPVDVLRHVVAEAEGNPDALRSWTARGRKDGAGATEGAVFAREAWWASSRRPSGEIARVGSTLSTLLVSVRHAEQAWERRGHGVSGILLRALEQARTPGVSARHRWRSAASHDANDTSRDDAEWIARVADAIRRRRRGVGAEALGEAALRDTIGRLLRARLGAGVDLDRVRQVARALRGTEGGAGETGFALLTALVAPPSSILGRSWTVTWAGLAGRLWAWGGVEGVSWISAWIGELAERMSPGARRDRALRSALHLVELWGGSSERNPANLARLGEVLATDTDAVLAWFRGSGQATGATPSVLKQSRVRWRLAGPIRHLAKLGRVPTEDARFLTRSWLLAHTVDLMNWRPDRLEAYVAFLRGMGSDTVRLGPGARWASLFASAEDAFLAWALVQRGRWLAGGAVEEDEVADVLSELVDTVKDYPPLGPFLVRNTLLVDRTLASVLRRPANAPNDDTEARRADVVVRLTSRIAVLKLACAWIDRGFPSPEGLVESVLRWWESVERRKADGPGDDDEPRYLAFPGWTVESVLVLSGGDAGFVPRILALAGSPWFRWEWIEAGWKYLACIPGVHALVREAWEGKPGPRVALEVVGRFGLGNRLRLHAVLDEGLAAWQRAEEGEGPEAGGWKRETNPGSEWPPDLLRELARVLAHRKVAGGTRRLPADLVALLDRPARLREEHERLTTLVAERGGAAGPAKRLANLENRLRTPGAVASWMAKDLRRALPKAVFRARWESLASVVDRALRRHWRRQFAIAIPQPLDDDWHNALLLGAELSVNRTLWRRLVRHEAAGDRTWRWNHPGNRAWIDRARAAGIDTDRWLGPHVWTTPRGGESWSIHAEDDPLRVLQMGNWFDTCLQRSGANNFSVIANAVEANKRVLYLRNVHGTVVGRKLVALVPEDDRGILIGFRTYGATVGWHEVAAGKSAGPWPKILFDLACARLARSVGAWLCEAGLAMDRLANRSGL